MSQKNRAELLKALDEALEKNRVAIMIAKQSEIGTESYEAEGLDASHDALMKVFLDLCDHAWEVE